jgi:hypothetical protein
VTRCQDRRLAGPGREGQPGSGRRRPDTAHPIRGTRRQARCDLLALRSQIRRRVSGCPHLSPGFPSDRGRSPDPLWGVSGWQTLINGPLWLSSAETSHRRWRLPQSTRSSLHSGGRRPPAARPSVPRCRPPAPVRMLGMNGPLLTARRHSGGGDFNEPGDLLACGVELMLSTAQAVLPKVLTRT